MNCKLCLLERFQPAISYLIFPHNCPSSLISLAFFLFANGICQCLGICAELEVLASSYLTHLVNIACRFFSSSFNSLFLSLPPSLSFSLWSRGLVRYREREISVCLVHFGASKESETNPGLSCLDASDLFAHRACASGAQLCHRDATAK